MAQVPDINVVASVGDFDPYDRDASLRYANLSPFNKTQFSDYRSSNSGPMTNVDGYYLSEQSIWQTPNASAAEPLASPPSYSPHYNGFTTPSSDSSGLEPEHFYHSPERNTNSISSYNNSPTTPSDSLHGTPEIMPSDDRILASISHIRTEGISRPERLEVCVDTSLLFSSQSNYPDKCNYSPGPISSPRLLSPYDIQPPAQLHRRHSHTRSAGDGQDFSLVTEFTPGVDGRRRLQRNKSAPTSRNHSPLELLNKNLRAINNTRSISPGDWEQATGDGIYNPGNDVDQASPSSSTYTGRDVVATERIRAASNARRLNPVICNCDVCGDGFTTNFARDRHMNSHTGKRPFPCTKPGCYQSFPTDSGRKRHEKSKTLHIV